MVTWLVINWMPGMVVSGHSVWEKMKHIEWKLPLELTHSLSLTLALSCLSSKDSLWILTGITNISILPDIFGLDEVEKTQFPVRHLSRESKGWQRESGSVRKWKKEKSDYKCAFSIARLSLSLSLSLSAALYLSLPYVLAHWMFL